MKISTKGIYGLKAMVDLAIHSNGDYIILKDISERQKISEGYLEQIFSSLRKSGIIKGRKGAQGGYILTKDKKEITVGQILRALEGELFVIPENKNDDKIEKCIMDNVWCKLNISINEIVDGISLEDLVVKYNKNDNINFMAYI